ncbi:hypothetical protein RCH12_002777 [Cryobacterium sp. MP_3.1]|uniref:hypothetical protein n=1 Tax=Cryobacterium sp. MP_3.1 TaxID=3071711 RepID=UPI002DF9D770|nr:hypothetical protein [Cryobacterium sp. MP_3.1]
MKQLKKIKFRVAAWSEIMTDDKVVAELNRRAVLIAAAANGAVAGGAGEDHFVVEENLTTRRPQRARAVIIAKTVEARLAESESGALTRALEAGRD